MDGVKLLNMAVFGLSLRTLNQLKGMVEVTLPDAVKVNWTNIAHPDLNILLINDMFLESTNIQRLLKNKEMKVLKLVGEQQGFSSASRDIFSLIEMDQKVLKDWLQDNIYPNDQYAACKNTASSRFIDQHLYVVPKQSRECASVDFVQKILHPTNGRIKIFDRLGELAVCDTRMQWVWVNHRRSKQATDLSLNFTHATTGDMQVQQSDAKQHHLQLWMWNVLWESPDYLNLAPLGGCFKLIRWPQPQLNQQHREILKIASCFSMGAEINQVAQHLSLSLTLVRQFVAASLALGFVEPISHAQAEFRIDQNIELRSEEIGKVKGFFSRLRAKLGL